MLAIFHNNSGSAMDQAWVGDFSSLACTVSYGCLHYVRNYTSKPGAVNGGILSWL